MWLCAALCVGILVGTLVYRFAIWMIVIPIAAVAIGMLLYGITKKGGFLFFAVVFGVGLAAFCGDCHLYAEKELSGGVLVEARVEATDAASGSVVLSDLVINGKPYKNYGYSLDVEGVLLGDTVVFYADVETHNFGWEDDYDRFLFSRKYRYTFENVEKTTVTGSEKTIFQKIRAHCRELMAQFIDEEAVGTCMTLLFGDKSCLSYEVRENMRGAGLSHVFAVSGLHVGFLVSLLSLIFRKINLGRWKRFFICTAFLIFYGFLTGFPAGVKRATITYVCFSLSVLFRRKADGLSSLALSAFLILLTNPREMFDISFLMSVAAVGGIVMFYQPVYRSVCRVKNKIFRYFFGILAVTLTANVFIFPISCSVFSGVQIYSAVGNMLLLPVLTVFFTCVACATILGCIYEGFGILFIPLGYAAQGIDHVAGMLSSLPYATLSVSSLGPAALFYVLFFLTLGRFNLMKAKIKIPLCAVFLSLMAVCLFVF